MSRLSQYLEAFKIKEKESKEGYEKEGKVTVSVNFPDNAIDKAALAHNDKVVEDAVKKIAKEKGIEPSKDLIKEIRIADKDIKPVINFGAIEAFDKKKELSAGGKGTVAEKILRFIENAGDKGVGLTDIQKFMLGDKYRGKESRGWYVTALYGDNHGYGINRPNIGLLKFWCEKTPEGKWKLRKDVTIHAPFYRGSGYNNYGTGTKEEKEKLYARDAKAKELQKKNAETNADKNKSESKKEDLPVKEAEGPQISKFKYGRFIQNAYKHNKPLGYMDMVELLYDGTIGQWSKKQRHDYRGYGAANLGNRYGKILANWFDKQNDGKYMPKEHLRKKVEGGKIHPFLGPNY